MRIRRTQDRDGHPSRTQEEENGHPSTGRRRTRNYKPRRNNGIFFWSANAERRPWMRCRSVWCCARR